MVGSKPSKSSCRGRTQAPQLTLLRRYMDMDGADLHPQGVCLDFIWVKGDGAEVRSAGVAGDVPSQHDATLYPSDHIAVWADIKFGGKGGEKKKKTEGKRRGRTKN